MDSELSTPANRRSSEVWLDPQRLTCAATLQPDLLLTSVEADRLAARAELWLRSATTLRSSLRNDLRRGTGCPGRRGCPRGHPSSRSSRPWLPTDNQPDPKVGWSRRGLTSNLQDDGSGMPQPPGHSSRKLPGPTTSGSRPRPGNKVACGSQSRRVTRSRLRDLLRSASYPHWFRIQGTRPLRWTGRSGL